MPIYTRHGDAGQTSLYTPKGAVRRVPKDDVRIEAYGTVDELNASIGVLRSLLGGDGLGAELRRVQEVLFHVGYDLSTLADPPPTRVTEDDVHTLEQAIDRMTGELEPLKRFILPSGPPPAAAAHAARTLCRRAERRAVALAASTPVNPVSLRYLNRLSDYLFTAARRLAGGDEPVDWRS